MINRLISNFKLTKLQEYGLYLIENNDKIVFDWDRMTGKSNLVYYYVLIEALKSKKNITFLSHYKQLNNSDMFFKFINLNCAPFAYDIIENRLNQ
jgi:hypothetical protein